MTDNTPDLPAPGKSSKSLLPDYTRRQALRKKRMRRDKLSRWGITAAGYGVVMALATIFIYLFYEVAPILRGATVTPQDSYQIPDTGANTYQLLLDRYEELGIQYTDRGEAVFFNANTGAETRRFAMPVPDDASVTSFGAAEAISNTTVFGFSNGEAVVARHAFDITFPGNVRSISPQMQFPLGETPIVIDEQGSALRLIAVENMQRGAGGTAVAAITDDGRLLLANITTRTNLLSGAVQVNRTVNTLPGFPGRAEKLLLDKSLRNLFVIDDRGLVHYYDITTPAQARLVQSVDVGGGSRVTAAEFLVGAVSIIFGTEQGDLSQWFLVRDEQNEYSLEEVRQFNSHGAAITAIAPEYTRKGFVAIDDSGQLGVHYGTSARTLFLDSVSEQPLRQVAISQINTGLLWLDGQGDVVSADLWNEHPQLSWDAMWNKVWYEGRA
ncbi:MAG: hypothetical protein WD600_03320, partial [Pseudohongiella sp.]